MPGVERAGVRRVMVRSQYLTGSTFDIWVINHSDISADVGLKPWQGPSAYSILAPSIMSHPEVTKENLFVKLKMMEKIPFPFEIRS